jgi:hypothetical protein
MGFQNSLYRSKASTKESCKKITSIFVCKNVMVLYAYIHLVGDTYGNIEYVHAGWDRCTFQKEIKYVSLKLT